MRRSLMLLIAAGIVVIAPVAANAGGDGGSNSTTHVRCRGTEWHGVGYAGCTQASIRSRQSVA